MKSCSSVSIVNFDQVNAGWDILCLFDCRAISTVMKPPNILIKTSNLNEFTKVKGLLNLLLQKDRYTIYQLNNEGFQKQPWSESCALLCYCVTEHEEIVETVLSKVSSFVLKENRKVIFYDMTKQFQVKGWLKKLDCRGNIIDFLYCYLI